MYKIGDKIPTSKKKNASYLLIIDASRPSKSTDNTDLPLYKVGNQVAILIGGSTK